MAKDALNRQFVHAQLGKVGSQPTPEHVPAVPFWAGGGALVFVIVASVF
jgi:hypothetical protein